MQIAENAHARLLFHKNKTAEVAVESLNSRAYGNEIVIRADVVQLHLRERFLQARCANPIA